MNTPIKTRGFTLIELLVVVAIIAILAGISFEYMGRSKAKGDDAAVKSNLATVRSVSEIFYLDNSNSYLPAGGAVFGIAECPVYDSSGTSMLSQSPNVAAAIAEAKKRGLGSSCYNSGEQWAIAVGLKENANTSWCVDSEGAARAVSALPDATINPSTFRCN